MSSLTEQIRQRLCGACGGFFWAAPQRDGMQHTCLTCTGGHRADLPEVCWQHSEHRFARDMLEAIPANRQKSKRAATTHHKRIKIAQDILALTAVESLQESGAVRLVTTYGKNAVLAFLDRMRKDSPLYAAVAPAFEQERRRRVPAPNRIPTHSDTPLPPEFEKAVQEFTTSSKRIREIRIQRGHRYSELTVRKREVDARHFCEFLAQQGLQFWPEVSQHHLDLFVGQVNSKAGERAYTFLQQVRRRFRLTQRFVRPRTRHKPPSEAMFGADVIPQVLKRVVACEDPQVVVAALLLTLWGQMVARSHELAYGNFRTRADKIEVLFAEQWTPLDTLTLRHLRRLHPAIGTTLPDQADVPVFTHSIWKLNAAVRKVVGLPVKKLRMTAIANIIRSGVTDRGAISRITGAMLNTVAYIERAFAWDLQMTVDPEIVKSRNEVIRGERTE